MNTNSCLNLYTVFHLNIAYSSIEEIQRLEVIKRCYWPLLKLADDYNLPLGIEASGYTLETINKLDPEWVHFLKYLISSGPVEFIGSGYAQLIGPLVPAKVNAANLHIGNKVYTDLLGIRPEVAMVNEQAYSAGLIDHYLEAGYKAIIMEWDNPALNQKNWDREWRYMPQYACGQHGEEIALIWNKSIAFQKFQRYAHGDMDLDQYLDYLISHVNKKTRTFPLYGNDVEIFDFRPGRYSTEAIVNREGEWNRLCLLFKTLKQDKRFMFISVNELLAFINQPGGGNRLSLETPEQPVPVKKQGKYNLSRWAVTGRDDIGINTACRRAYQKMSNCSKFRTEHWQELCYLWSSDFRTHITDQRWLVYRDNLDNFDKKLSHIIINDKIDRQQKSINKNTVKKYHNGNTVKIKEDRHLLIIETDHLFLKLNTRRGLAIDGLWFDKKNVNPFLGTLIHGYYNDIRYGADWYSGHLVLERLGQPKVTDLEPIEAEIYTESDKMVISGTIISPLGNINKKIAVHNHEPKLTLSYKLDWEVIPSGSFRLGFITLHPEQFDRSTLFYRTCNGGNYPECFYLANKRVDHGSAVSFLVSASSGLGLTEGWIEMGDNQNCLRVTVNDQQAALIGLITYHEIDGKYFYRLALSAGEMDETRKSNSSMLEPKQYEFTIGLVEQPGIKIKKVD